MSYFDELKSFIDPCVATHNIAVLNAKRWTISEFEQVLNILLNSELNNDSSVEDYLNLKFRELLRPFDELENGKKIYCKCQAFESDDGIEYSFSALTDEMLIVDDRYFSGMDDYYNTEFAANTIDGNTVSVSMASLLNGYFDINSFNPLANVKFKSVIDLLYKPYYYSFTVSDASQAEEIAQMTGQDWWEVTVSNKGNSEPGTSEESSWISGCLVYAASPLEFKQVEAKWIKKVDLNTSTKLNIKSYQNSNDQFITNTLNTVFENVTGSETSVYRVGDANSVLITNITNGVLKKVIFDLGLPNDCVMNKNAGSVPSDDTQKKLRSINPDVFLISHWHMDHVKAAFLLNRRVYAANSGVRWIAPLYVNRGIDCSVDRLVKYLVVNKQIGFVREGYEYINLPYCLYRINTTLSDEADNNNCLVLIADKTALPGDCRFLDWIKLVETTNQNNNKSGSIENIIVPHHGAINALEDSKGVIKAEEVKQKLKKIFSNNKKKAIVCTGHGYNNHPHPEIRKMFIDLGFNSFEETNSGDTTIDI